MTRAPRAYEANGDAVGAAQFIRIACDPKRSAVVEACAGSGKTWLLVARMLRLLLAGAEPSELLAITFTRKAAQEMRGRLVHLLRELALRPDDEVHALLLERGIEERDLPRLMPVARELYGRMLASPRPLSIDTFHGWFARLIQLAPLSAGVPHGYMLVESTGELMTEAYRRFMQAAVDERQPGLNEALMLLYELVGDWNAKRLLDAFVDKRAEWWAANRAAPDAPGSMPMQWLYEASGGDLESDHRLDLWEDEILLARLMQVSRLLGQGTALNRKRGAAIEAALAAGPGAENFEALCNAFFDAAGEVRRNTKTAALKTVLERSFGGDGLAVFDEEFNALAAILRTMARRSAEPAVLALNSALFAAGGAYLEHYQAIKAEQRVLDFSDLEWHAYTLLNDEEHAAYLLSRLDTRYRHVLLDEFQDANPLQWSIVRAWLGAYGDDAQKPSVFIVGDPKQSIYRFRRAEPRVFAAARELLAAQGADFLRTNQTRRNAGAIIATLNETFTANPLFHPQTTLAGDLGAVWRLPLIGQAGDAGAGQDAQLPVPASTGLPISPHADEEDLRRLEEGRAVAKAIVMARQRIAAWRGEAMPWSQVMLLVKKRAHLAAYERALREAGIPYLSDKRGGLLSSLEVEDLTALLTFLVTPGDNLALAHVLKSPVFGAHDDDLIFLAQRLEDNWWMRLQGAAGEDAPEALRRAARLLESWLAAAPHLPVHDLLDRILHQGQLIARYAQAVPPLLRTQAIGNIEAFTELALNLDAGRYPSLQKFIDALHALKKGSNTDAPDEANIDLATDAVRILTIHGAKGLEASIVALLDANHSEPVREDLGILCDWPGDADTPVHFSAFGRKRERGVARDALFAAEESFRAQEDWNLLYVAATRARGILIVSGIAGRRSGSDDGVIDGSWYQRMLAAPEIDMGLDDTTENTAGEGAEGAGPADAFCIPVFDPPVLAAPINRAQVAGSALIDAAAGVPLDEDAGEAIGVAMDEDIDRGMNVRGGASIEACSEEDFAFRILMERLTQSRRWPLLIPDAETLARWLPCPPAVAAIIGEQAATILARPGLERFFNPRHYRRARNALEAVIDGAVLRFDRVVEFEDEVWILDYQRRLPPAGRALNSKRLAHHATAAMALFPGKAIRVASVPVSDGLDPVQ